jgi:hypothetical protein
MIHFLLARLEANPSAVFYEQELLVRFPEQLSKAVSSRLLTRESPTDSYSYQLSRPLLVVPGGKGEFEAWDEDDPEAEPIVLSAADLTMWRPNLDALVERLREENGLEGAAEHLNDRLLFLGEIAFAGSWLGAVLALVNESCALPVLRELPTLLPPGRYPRLAVVCPNFEPVPSVRRELESLGMLLVRLSEDSLEIELPDIAGRFGTVSSPSRQFVHSGDYASVNFSGRHFQFTPRQAAVVKRLHKARRAGTPDVPWPELRAIVEDVDGSRPEKIGDVFKGVDGWRSLITFERTGFWRLNI